MVRTEFDGEIGQTEGTASGPGRPALPGAAVMVDSPAHQPTPRDMSLSDSTELDGLDFGRVASVNTTRTQLLDMHHVKAEDRNTEHVRLLLTTLKDWWVIRDAPSQMKPSLCRCVVIEDVQAGARIFSEGQAVRRSYYIFEGQVQVKNHFNLASDSHTSSHPYRLETLQAGECFGEMAGPRDHAPRGSEVLAKQNCVLLSIEHQEYWRMLQGTKEADEAKRKLRLLRSMFPSAEPDENEAEMIRREEDLRRMASMLKLQTVKAGEPLASQGSEISELFFIVSGECDLTVEVSLCEIYPGSVSKYSGGKKNTQGSSDKLAGDETLATRIQLSTVQSPRQLGTTRRCRFTVSRLFRGDILGDEHVWGEDYLWKVSASAIQTMEVAILEFRSWQHCPSRFMPSLYDSCKLKSEDRQSVLGRLLRLERNGGWKLTCPISEVFPGMPERRPNFATATTTSKHGHKNRHGQGRVADQVQSIGSDDAKSKRRVMFFYIASNSTTSNYVQSKKKRTYGLEEESFQDAEAPQIAADLLFGGRQDLLGDRPHTARPSTSPESKRRSDENPFEHPRRPDTARSAPATIQDILFHAKRPPWVFGDKAVLRPRNASVSATPFRVEKIEESAPRSIKHFHVPRLVQLRPLADAVGATLETTETLTSRGAAFTPRPVSQRTRRPLTARP